MSLAGASGRAIWATKLWTWAGLLMGLFSLPGPDSTIGDRPFPSFAATFWAAGFERAGLPAATPMKNASPMDWPMKNASPLDWRS